ncbi:hypothetical protein KPH14_001481 [Odynerus spinipes]|uniref:WD repeat-containing protein 34 n=1 Tax=Odynerus spinipes TaxID=1348599 RepID=A0AAD9RVI8_9HYME|nr:hypothetical protein KPH14_001481 [Odynerus spinipes]
MFTNQSFDTVGFDSQVSVAKPEVSTNVQTTEIVYSSSQVQTTEKRNAETQTVQAQAKAPSVDYNKLADFLKRVTPGVLEVLDKAYNTDAFDDYDTGTATNTSANLQLLQRLSTVQDLDKEKRTSNLLWSIGGGSLAVSHRFTYHTEWCSHFSKVQLYALSKEDKLSDVPNKTLNINSCVTTLSYHPEEPMILGGGLHNGDVIVWNLRKDDPTSTIIGEHSDTVSQVCWKPRTVNDVSFLVSSSRDGYINVYKLLANFTEGCLHKQFKITKEHNPVENLRPRSAGGKRERAAEAGLTITSFDFSWKDPAIFIAGTLCGGIYKCSLDSVSPIEGDNNLFDPVVGEYDRHEGSVTCVKCSPTRNLFITCSTSKEIRIYDFEQNVSQQLISVENSIIGFTWMAGNQDIFATFGAGSTVKFYNVTDGKVVTDLKIVGSNNEGSTSLCVNSKRDILAIGDTLGNVEIWKVPRQLF